MPDTAEKFLSEQCCQQNAKIISKALIFLIWKGSLNGQNNEKKFTLRHRIEKHYSNENNKS